jgi:hypothetical protein
LGDGSGACSNRNILLHRRTSKDYPFPVIKGATMDLAQQRTLQADIVG